MDKKRLYWCNSHRYFANRLGGNGHLYCEPPGRRGTNLMPCIVVDLTDECEIVEDHEEFSDEC